MRRNIIAQRELVSGGRTFQVRFEKPRIDKTGDYACRFSLVDEDGTEVVAQAMYGVDAVQALVFAITIADLRLRAEGLELTWLESRHTGLPRVLDPNHPGGLSFYIPQDETEPE